MKLIKLEKIISSLFPFIVVFVGALYLPNDADLGWHLKYGEYFFQHGALLRENIFSTEMTNFHWANTSWLTDLITYSIFSMGGFLGLTLAGALVVMLTFFFFSKAFQLTYWQQSLIFPFLLYLEDPVNSVSFRGQLMSIALLAVLIYVLLQYDSKRGRSIYILPLLFLLWSNLHGQFILGLGLLIFWFISFAVREYISFKKNFSLLVITLQKPVLIIILSLSTTFINPFGAGVYLAVLEHFGNPLLKSVIEYLPPQELSISWWNQIIIGMFLSIGILCIYFQKKFKGLSPIISLTTLLYGLSLYVKRYSWSMYYLTIPFLQPIADFIKPSSAKMRFIAGTILFSITLTVLLVLKSPLRQFQLMSWERYCHDFLECSPKSMEFLLSQQYKGPIMTLYNWGGWMIWNYPQIKPSIDGRMHLWKDEKGYSAFKEYYAYEQNLEDINNSKYKVVYISSKKPIYQRLIQLVRENKWSIVYQDRFAAIFVRNQ